MLIIQTFFLFTLSRHLQENIQLKAKVQKLEGELDTLKADYTDRAGEIVNLKDQIDELKASQPMELNLFIFKYRTERCHC